MIWKILFALSSIILEIRAYEKGCPPPDDIFPCTCTTNPVNTLSCLDIVEADILGNAFIRSSDYSYNTVRLENIVLPSLPADMFQGVKVRELVLFNSTLIQLFDKIPENLQMLDVLHIERTIIQKPLYWEHLRNFPNLRTLNIWFNRIKVLDEKFSEYVTKNLEELTLYETGTKTIKPGVLAEYKKLNFIAIEKCNLSELSRNMLPTSFKGRYLHFNYNKLKTIPVDLFDDMPNLQTVGLAGNMIDTIPPSSSLKKIDDLLLEGNPITCDCRIYWLVKYKPEVVTGACQYPDQYRGILLKDLQYNMFAC